MDFLISLIIGLAVGGITLLVLFRQLKTVVQQRAAADYVDPNSLKLSQQQDLFLYKKTDRAAIQRQAPPPQGK